MKINAGTRKFAKKVNYGLDVEIIGFSDQKGARGCFSYNCVMLNEHPDAILSINEMKAVVMHEVGHLHTNDFSRLSMRREFYAELWAIERAKELRLGKGIIEEFFINIEEWEKIKLKKYVQHRKAAFFLSGYLRQYGKTYS